MELFLQVFHIMVSIVLVVAVLIQHGKGADIGAVFGGGASNTVFGSRGAGNFLTKLTTGAAIVFMLTSLALSYIANTQSSRSIFGDDVEGAPAGFEEVETPTTDGVAEDAGGFAEVPSEAAGGDESGAGATSGESADPSAAGLGEGTSGEAETTP